MSPRKDNSTSRVENYRASTTAALKRLNTEVRRSQNGKYEIHLNPAIVNRIVSIYIDDPLNLESPQPSPHLGNAAWSLPAELRESYHFKKEVKWKTVTKQEKEQALRCVGKKTNNLKNLFSPHKTESLKTKTEYAKPSMYKSNQISKTPKCRFVKTSLRP